MSDWLPQGVHLVGSVPFGTAEEVMRTVSSRLETRLASVPDGEVGERRNWVRCQLKTFEHVPQIIKTGMAPKAPADGNISATLSAETVVPLLGELETNYDTWAINSYRVFSQLREEGQIAKATKFQVCLPTPLGVLVSLLDSRFREAVEPVYEAAITKALRNIQAEIPHQDLLIQFDAALEFALLEDVPSKEGNVYGMGKENIAWFTDVQGGIFDRLLHVVGSQNIDDDVAVGIHLCYGDAGHKHFIEPTDTTILAEVAEKLLTNLQRKLEYIHLPVPQSRDDDAYFEPLKKTMPLFAQNQTHLYLGLVHADDFKGTQKRINTARRILGEDGWGIATECGLSRTPDEQMDSIFEICGALSRPQDQVRS